MQGYTLSTVVRAISLDCCDMVLGVEWLTTLGPILWDFSNLRMEFNLNGMKHVLRGVTKTDCKFIKGTSLNKLILKDPQIALLRIIEGTALPRNDIDCSAFHFLASGDDLMTDPDIENLITPFTDLFTPPSSLPPFRKGFDHNPIARGL